MGRAPSIRNTPAQPRVDLLLDQGVPVQQIAREMAAAGFTISIPAIYRYRASRRSTLARVFAQELTPLDVAERLLSLADAARASRQAAVATGSAAAAARAVQVEASILGKLADLDIDPRSFRSLYDEVHGFTAALRHLVQSRPDVAYTLAEVMAESEQTRDLAKAIFAALRPVQETA